MLIIYISIEALSFTRPYRTILHNYEGHMYASGATHPALFLIVAHLFFHDFLLTLRLIPLLRSLTHQ